MEVHNHDIFNKHLRVQILTKLNLSSNYLQPFKVVNLIQDSQQFFFLYHQKTLQKVTKCFLSNMYSNI